jgi:hypothetical protein
MGDRCVCHAGSVCGKACKKGRCHDGCSANSRGVFPRTHPYSPTRACMWPMDDGGSCDAFAKDHLRPARAAAEKEKG